MASLCWSSCQSSFTWYPCRLLPSRPLRTSKLTSYLQFHFILSSLLEIAYMISVWLSCLSKHGRIIIIIVCCLHSFCFRLQHLWRKMGMSKYQTIPIFLPSCLVLFTVSPYMYAGFFFLIFFFFILYKSFLYCNFLRLLYLSFQADPDTDEVYARMTLQPVPSVSTISYVIILLLSNLISSYKIFKFRVTWFADFTCVVWHGCHIKIRYFSQVEQATTWVFLQATDS